MSAEVEVVDVGGVGPEFFAPATTGALDLLLAQYEGMRSRIEQVAELLTLDRERVGVMRSAAREEVAA